MVTRSTICAISPVQFRWLILLIFPAAFVSACQITGNTESAYSFGAAMAACTWLIYRLDSLNPDAIGVWLVIAVFVTFYFLRYPLLLLDPGAVAAIHPDSIAPLFLNDRAGLTQALKLASMVFVTFCIVARLMLGPRGTRTGASRARVHQGHDPFMVWLIVVVPLLMIVLGYIAYAYRIGQMGAAPGEPLPFRLKGVIFYARHVLIPLLIVAIIYRATLSRDGRSLSIGLLLLAIHGVSDTVLRASKSSLLLCLLLVVFLSVSGGIRIRRKGLMIVGALVLGAILLMPTITYYRALRFGSDAGLWQLFASAFGAANQDFIGVLQKSFNAVYFRIPGIETIWAINSLAKEPLGTGLIETMRSPFGVTGYLNFEIYQVPVESYTLFAPGFVGWFYLAGGEIGLVLGGIALALLCVKVPRWFYGGYLRWSPVANTFFLWILFISLTDGTLDSNFLLFSTGVVSLASLEFFDHVIPPRF